MSLNLLPAPGVHDRDVNIEAIPERGSVVVDKPAARARGGQRRLELADDDLRDYSSATPAISCPCELAELLRHLASSPYTHTEFQTHGVNLRARDVAIGTLNFRTCTLSVSVPPDLVRPLLDANPRLGRTKDGVSLRAIDTDSVKAAEASLRWRIGLQRFAHQLRAASP
jgi:hypothetical protein